MSSLLKNNKPVIAIASAVAIGFLYKAWHKNYLAKKANSQDTTLQDIQANGYDPNLLGTLDLFQPIFMPPQQPPGTIPIYGQQPEYSWATTGYVDNAINKAMHDLRVEFQGIDSYYSSDVSPFQIQAAMSNVSGLGYPSTSE